MFDRKTSAILILIALLMIGLIVILVVAFIIPKIKLDNIVPSMSNNNLYFITQSEAGYGISKTNGDVVVEPVYTTVARIDDSVYLRNASGSYIYFLTEKKSVSFGSKENEVYYAYNNKGEILPYYIFRYGENSDSSIYRIYSTRGVKLDNKDFATLNDAYRYINAAISFKPLGTDKLQDSVKDTYQVSEVIPYATVDNKTQYIAKRKKVAGFGIIDETGEVILDFTADKIETLLDSKNAVKVEKNNKTYIFTNSKKMIEVENGFEYVVEEEYIVQKKGNTVNKVYTIAGDVIISDIYDYNMDFIKLMTNEGVTYLLVQEEPNKYSLYDMSKGAKSDTIYENVVTKYMEYYNANTKIEGIIFKSNGANKTLDLKDMKIYSLNVLQNIYSVLDNGNKYIYK